MSHLYVLVLSLIPALSFFVLNVFIPGPNVLNTIATSMGSGRASGISCALATGLGVILTALLSLFGVSIILYKIPIIYNGLTVIGAFLLLYFAKRYIYKSLKPYKRLVNLKNIENRLAFKQAFLVLISNPKMMTTYIAVVSLFPIVARDINYIILFSLIAGISSFTGHLLFATIFSTRIASEIYMKLYKPINFLVGTGFILYSIKLIFPLIQEIKIL